MITATHNRQAVAVKRRATTIPERRRPEARDDASDEVFRDEKRVRTRRSAEDVGEQHKVRHIVIN